MDKKINKSTAKRLANVVTENKPRFLLSIIITVVAVVCTLLSPLFVGKAIDAIIARDNVRFVTFVILIAIFVALATVFSYFSNRMANIIATKAASKLRQDALTALYNAPLSFVDKMPAGEAAARISGDADTITDGLVAALSQLINGGTTIIITLILMFAIDYRVAFAVGALTPLSMVFAIVLTKKMRTLFKANADTKGELSADTLNIAHNIKLLKLYGQENEAKSAFKRVNARLYEAGYRSQFAASIVNPGARLVNAFVYTAVTALGAYLAIKNQISIGDLSVFLAYTSQYSKPFNEITNVIAELQSALSAAERMFYIIDQKGEKSNGIALKQALSGQISIENVDFSYDKNTKIFQNLCLEIPKGTRLAIVGASGSGKSTLINLLLRFYGLNDGKIVMDDINIDEISLDPLRKQFGMVLQEGVIFNRSVAENIAFAKPNATLNEIKDAAIAANCDRFIEKLHDGYDTILNDSVKLSTGQEQLICIARVMLINPNIFILDEATSNIDTRTEKAIHSAFKELSKGKTSLTVAHRLAAIMDCDLIVVLDKGAIVEKGTHEELIKLNGLYGKMFRLAYGS